jgi:glutamate formiminotransferase
MIRASSESSALLECIPNFSEGRRAEVVDAIVAQMKTVDGAAVLDVKMDASHNRAVVTLAGPPAAVVEAAFQSVRQAARLIDMEAHRGQHPRVGATDVLPLVPLRGLTMDECVVLARGLGRRIGDELDIPVYMYGEAALLAERRDLPALRRGEYEGLRGEILWNVDRRPDFGPSRLGRAGATVVGARLPLIAFNVNLASRDLRAARGIAREVRESNGGLPAVRAMGVDLPELAAVQVSMNLTDYARTSMLDAFRAVEAAAGARGIAVLHAEVVGLVPQQALPPDAELTLKLASFSQEQVLERRLGLG